MATRIEARVSGIKRTLSLAALVTVGLSGCSFAQEAEDLSAPSTTQAATGDLDVEVLAGWGTGFAEPTAHPLTIPDEAQSVVVQFGCAGGHDFFVEFGDSMMLEQSPISGVCDGLAYLSLPIESGSDTSLWVSIPEGVRWVAQTAYSREPFENDLPLAQECEEFAGSFSALFNADQGFSEYQEITAEEWQVRVDAAAAELDTAAEKSSSMLGELLIDLESMVSHEDREVGRALNNADEAVALAMKICGANQTPVVISAEFGG